MRHPAATEELMRGLVEASKDSEVFPEIFQFTQTMWMHLGEKPYHPGNRRVKMHVHVRDLQLRYGLSVDALQHILAVRLPPSQASMSRVCLFCIPGPSHRWLTTCCSSLMLRKGAVYFHGRCSIAGV